MKKRGSGFPTISMTSRYIKGPSNGIASMGIKSGVTLRSSMYDFTVFPFGLSDIIFCRS